MSSDAYLGRVLAIVGVLGLLLPGFGWGPPAWCWLAISGAGLVHSLAWRAAGVRQVSGKERRAHARRLKNSEIREKRLLRRTDRIARRCKETLAEVREHPGMPWAHEIASVVRELQAGQKRHEEALVRSKWLADKAAADLSGILTSRTTDNEE